MLSGFIYTALSRVSSRDQLYIVSDEPGAWITCTHVATATDGAGYLDEPVFCEALLSHSFVLDRLRCILASGRFWDDSVVSAEFMDPRHEPIHVKLNGPALEPKPKRNAAPGTGRPSQESNLAGAKGLILRKPVSIKAQDTPYTPFTYVRCSH